MSVVEAFGIGANVVGVVVVGLQAAKFIAESVSKYQDAEDDHRRFLDAIQRLARMLTDVNEILKSDEDKLRYSQLYNAAKKCEDELVKIHKNILKWTESTSGKKSKTVRTWKMFKLIFLEDNSKRWLESLESHYGFILFQLNKIQLDDRKEQKVVVERIESNLAQVSDTISNIEDAQIETLVRMDKAETNITQQIEINKTAVQGLSASVGVNFNQVNKTLNSMHSSVKTFANNQFYKAAEEREKDEFEKATGRILRLGAAAVTRREASVGPGQTEQVLGGLLEILKFAKKGQFSVLSTGVHETCDSLQKIRKISGLLASSDSLAVGYDHQVVKDLRARKSTLSATNIFQWEQSEFLLRVTENLRYDGSGDRKSLQSGDFSRNVTRITYLPKRQGIDSIVDIYLVQPETFRASIYAGLSFRTMIPEDSEILTAIFHGSVNKVRELLSTGRACVNDCDAWGQNLLIRSLIQAGDACPVGYSEDNKKILAASRLEIAKYLISQGSDVTHLDNDNYDPFSAARAWGNYDALDLLLENGANPMIRTQNILSYARNLDEISWKRFLNQISEFYDINDTITWGFGFDFRPMPLLHMIIGAYTISEIWGAPYIFPSTSIPINYHLPSYDIKEVVRKLIRSGADPACRATDEGENCLHIVLLSTAVPDCRPMENGLVMLKDLLLFLVGEIGFDVRAVTKSGCSVTDIAFDQRCPAGRCIWPVWVEVLIELGYNPLEVAEGGIFFEREKHILTSRASDYCSCEYCLPIEEDGYVQVVGDYGMEYRNEGLCQVAYAIDIGKQTTIPPSNCDSPCDDFEFFEMLALTNEEMENCKPSSDALVSNWAHILEDWESIDDD
ncbi:uncharacterized protein DFL_006702 [Arthrobotrys flagrans]|uniref:Azaphilone pigments biosynthesis cluster protein L N-terminal domain-containing protein n=1 Tax=Arthrobotrys flagrans TaxID=97331 RepID=A0A436ZTN3_ARTFL|nr:hypothetical protein DFL_006702 [Arthrobotrys flagrans]